MVHYSGVSIVDFERVNIGWDLSGSFQKLESRKNLENSHAWPSKGFQQHASFSKETIGLYPNQNSLLLRQAMIRIWYLLWLILLFDTQFKKVLQIYTNKSFSSSSYSCLAMKVCESEVYKHIVSLLDMDCSCFFSEKFESWSACSHQNLCKISEGKIWFSHIFIIWQKNFIIHQLHKKSSYNHLK